MALMNYTTSIAASKTGGEVQSMLMKAGATGIGMDFEAECVKRGVRSHLSEMPLDY